MTPSVCLICSKADRWPSLWHMPLCGDPRAVLAPLSPPLAPLTPQYPPSVPPRPRACWSRRCVHLAHPRERGTLPGLGSCSPVDVCRERCRPTSIGCGPQPCVSSPRPLSPVPHPPVPLFYPCWSAARPGLFSAPATPPPSPRTPTCTTPRPAPECLPRVSIQDPPGGRIIGGGGGGGVTLPVPPTGYTGYPAPPFLPNCTCWHVSHGC